MNDCYRRNAIIILTSVISALVITYISGFFRPLLPERTVDVLQWGSPFPYLHRVVTFHGQPFADWNMAVVDFIFWFIIIFVIIYLANFLWGRNDITSDKSVK